jgi:hypothetical protein
MYVPPITRDEFLQNAEPAKLSLSGLEMEVAPDDFSTGSFGWKYRERHTVIVNGKKVDVIVQVNATVVGSKRL